jgi:hypothetical protein
MQSYFSLLPWDHLASKFELFWLYGFLKRFSKIFLIEVDVEMFFPYSGPITPGTLNQINWFCTISGSIRVNLSFYGTVVHEKKLFKQPYPIFALSFEEDLDLHLNKLEFPSCKICLYQVWLKLARCFILKYFFQYTNVKIVSPLVSPNLKLGDHNLYKLKSALCQKAFT